jgi:hypothetical protein
VIFGHTYGGTFLLDVGTLAIGVILMILMNTFRPAFFRGETLNRNSPTLVTEDFGTRPAT